jgi:hypothetical protein
MNLKLPAMLMVGTITSILLLLAKYYLFFYGSVGDKLERKTQIL